MKAPIPFYCFVGIAFFGASDLAFCQEDTIAADSQTSVGTAAAPDSDGTGSDSINDNDALTEQDTQDVPAITVQDALPADVEPDVPPITVVTNPVPKLPPIIKKSNPANNTDAGSSSTSGDAHDDGLENGESRGVKVVPLGVSIKTGRELENSGADRVQEIVRDVPNVNVSGFGDGRSTNFLVRGVGAFRDPLSPDDNSFVVHVDGVPQPLFSADVGYFDMESVEVLKGPQGTRFGRNTTGGALYVTTRKPTDNPEFSIRGEVGEDGYRMTELIASGPLVSKVLAGRVALRFSGSNGFVSNTITGNDLGEHDVVSGRGTIRFTSSKDTVVTASFSTDYDKRTFPFFVLRDAPNFPVAALVEDDSSRRRSTSGNLTIDHNTKAFEIKSTTGLNDVKTSDIFLDDTEGFLFSRISGLPSSVFSLNDSYSDWSEDRQTFSQEFIFRSPAEKQFNWTAGVSYFRSRFDADYLNLNAFTPATNGRRFNALATDSFAGFGEATVPIGYGLKVTAGGRATRERKTYDLKYVGVGAPGTVDEFRDLGTLEYNFVTGRASLEYDLDFGGTAYTRVSRGIKTGGYPRLAIDASLGRRTKPFSSSEIWTYEAGYNFRSLDNSSYVDATAFYNDVRDEHLLTFDSATFSFRPANISVVSYGFELGGGFKISDSLSMTGAVGYTHAELVDIDPDRPIANAINGNRPANIPSLTTSVALEYRQPLMDIGLGVSSSAFGNIAWQYVGDRAADEANSFFLPSYKIVNGRVGIEVVDWGEIYLFGKNLLDETPQLAGAFVSPNAEVVVPGRGRVVGVGTLARW